VLEVNWHPSPKQLRLFAVLLAALLAGVGVWCFAPETSRVAPSLWLVVAAVVGVTGLVCPRAVRGIYVVWMVAAFPIGWLVSHLLLAAVFFLVITPIGLILRLIGYDPLQRRFDRAAKTYWQPRENRSDTARYFKQY